MTIAIIAGAVLAGAFIWAQISASNARRNLTTLRANCFITNAKGHRVRYANATREEQARAEGLN